MSDDKYRVIILDDDYELGELLKEYLQNTRKCLVTYVSSEPDFWECIAKEPFDILFLDYKLPNTTGLDILARMGQVGVNIPTVMMTGEGSENIAARAIQSGALDYLVKGEYSFSVLPSLIHKAVRLREMQRAMQQYLEQIRYQAMLLDNMRDAVVVWGLDGTITYWNAAAEQLFQAASADRLGRRVGDVYFPCFDPPVYLPDLKDVGNYQIEHRFLLPNDEKTWISAHITTLYSEGIRNTPIGYMNVARDITPRKQEQEALVMSQHFVKRILDTSPNIIYILDLHRSRIRYMNSEFRVILGHPVEDFTNSTFEFFLSHVHSEDHSNLAQHLHALQSIKEGEVLEIEYRFRSARNDWRWLKGRETLFSRGENGRPAEIIGVMQDVTESKLADEKLQKSEARYRAIVEDHQTEMICRFLPDTTLTFVNEAYCRYYDWERDTLVGSSFLEPVIEDERSVIIEKLSEVNASAPVTSFEQRVRLAGGKIRWQEWVSRAICDQNNQFIEFQAVGRDITDRKMMEEKLQTAQNHLAQAARLSSIGELASGVAHQISNPMTTIIGEAQLLSQQLNRDHPGRESADAIIQAGWRAQEVINELMKFSEPAHTPPEPVSINETIEKALLLAGAHIQASGIQLTVDLKPGLPPIKGNPRQLTDLWVNLLLLARSSFVQGDNHNIHILTREIDRGNIFVKVTDNGIPIPEEQYDKIFEPQLIPTGSGRGTGMELSLCREIVRQNRGQISISGNGKETSFSILFAAEGM